MNIRPVDGIVYLIIFCIAVFIYFGCKLIIQVVNATDGDDGDAVENDDEIPDNLSDVEGDLLPASNSNNIILISNIQCLINDECPICIEQFKGNDELYQLKCGHIFHTHCITEWININNICPTCRNTVINEV
tara:strand:- start:150 stop:545 length:396 start_codon:yes stop_codon:yes gene_type:complete